MINGKKISLIRHAESHANVGLKTSEPAEIELTDKGHQQAQELAESIHEMPDIVITSPFVRTLQTAKPLLDKFLQVKHEQWPIYEFNYLSLLRCHNTNMEHRIPWATEYWEKCDPDYCDGDGAESFGQFIERIRDAINKLRQRQENRIIVFSHMLFISALNWGKQRNLSGKISSADMQDFKQYLFENSVTNCQIVLYSL
jgi:broad specificity phosphatase PhoE